jgi:hypothetical protein
MKKLASCSVTHSSAVQLISDTGDHHRRPVSPVPSIFIYHAGAQAMVLPFEAHVMAEARMVD